MRPRERDGRQQDGPGAMVASTTDDSSTELLRARRESADERYRRLLEHSPDAICVHQDGRLVYVNRAGVSWMAADSAEALVGSMITDFVDAASIPAMLDRIAGLRRQGDVSAPSEAVLLKFDGGRLDVEAVSVLTVWNDEPAYQVIFRDLTTQKAAQAALRYQAALVDHVSDAIIATSDAATFVLPTVRVRPSSLVSALLIRSSAPPNRTPASFIARVRRGGILLGSYHVARPPLIVMPESSLVPPGIAVW